MALKEISMVIPNNSCTALLGQNGAGKTTLISILTGQLNTTNGYAFVKGHDMMEETSLVQV